MDALEPQPPSLDPQPWTTLLDRLHPQDRADTLACLDGFERSLNLIRSDYREEVLSWARRLADAGLGRRAFPAVQADGRPSRFVAVFETLALFDLSLAVKAGIQFGLFAGSVHDLGGERHRRLYLKDAVDLALPGCFAMTERSHGSNVRRLASTATYDPATDEIIVHTPSPAAQKDWIGNAAADARVATVFAQLHVGGESHGVHAILVPIRDGYGRTLPRVHIEDCGPKMGLNGVDNGRLSFDEVRVPRENLLDRFGGVAPDGTYRSPVDDANRRLDSVLGVLVGARVAVAGGAVSVAKTALTIAVRYSSGRRQFGPLDGAEVPLLDLRAQQQRLLPQLAATYGLAFAQQALCERLDEGADEGLHHVDALAAGLKAHAARHAIDTVQACREACGAQGYATVNRFADLRADSDVFSTFGGDNTVLRLRVARALLSDFNAEYADVGLLGVVRHLMGRVTQAAFDRNPFITRWKDADHLRDGQYHLALLEARTADLLDSVAGRLRSRLEDGMDPFFAFNVCQMHLLALATAHVEAVILRAFQDAVVRLEGAHRHVLELLVDLYGLRCIEADRGWFLENGYLDPGKARAVRDQVEQLCLEVRPHATALVDAFGIPDEILGAPIGRRAPR